MFRATYVAPGYQSEHEDIWVESMLTTKTGIDNDPGDSTPSTNWPGFAPGGRGVLNTLAPTLFNTTAIVDLEQKPPILWIHGAQDAIVGDASFFDLNQLGKAGIIPGWPGDDVAPPQPMIRQTARRARALRGRGRAVHRLELENCGHSPHLECPSSSGRRSSTTSLSRRHYSARRSIWAGPVEEREPRRTLEARVEHGPGGSAPPVRRRRLEASVIEEVIVADEGASSRLADAPAPDDERKPDTPREVTKRSWKYVLRKSLREFVDDECPDRAASLTYYGVLALFPGLLALTSLLALVGQGQRAIDALFGIVEQVAPGEALEVIREPLESFSASPAAGLGFITGLVVAIWSASGYVGAFSRAMNRIYEIDEGRPFWKLRPMQLLVTIVTLVLVVVIAVILVVSGPVTEVLGDMLGVGEAVEIVWEIAKWPLLALAVILAIAILYYATPNAKQPKFRWISLGAVVAIVALVIVSGGFALYVGELLELRPDVRFIRRGDRVPALALARQLRTAVRGRVRRRARAGAPVAGRHRGRGGHPAPAERHAQEREGGEEGAGGRRARAEDPPRARERREDAAPRPTEGAGGRRRSAGTSAVDWHRARCESRNAQGP